MDTPTHEVDWAFCPDDGRPPRLIRFTLPHDAPARCVAMLDIPTNVLRVSRALYDICNEMQRSMILKTRKSLTYMQDLEL